MSTIRGTTVVMVRRGKVVSIAADGQITLGDIAIKQGTRKVMRLGKYPVIVGFAGVGADSLALVARLEDKLAEFGGSLRRAVVELAKEWRTDKVLRHLETFMVVADVEDSFLVSGRGDLITPDKEEGYEIIAIGSGGPYAYAAAKALTRYTTMKVQDIARRALEIAATICIYTNSNITVECLGGDE